MHPLVGYLRSICPESCSFYDCKLSGTGSLEQDCYSCTPGAYGESSFNKALQSKDYSDQSIDCWWAEQHQEEGLISTHGAQWMIVYMLVFSVCIERCNFYLCCVMCHDEDGDMQESERYVLGCSGCCAGCCMDSPSIVMFACLWSDGHRDLAVSMGLFGAVISVVIVLGTAIHAVCRGSLHGIFDEDSDDEC